MVGARAGSDAQPILPCVRAATGKHYTVNALWNPNAGHKPCTSSNTNDNASVSLHDTPSRKLGMCTQSSSASTAAWASEQVNHMLRTSRVAGRSPGLLGSIG